MSLPYNFVKILEGMAQPDHHPVGGGHMNIYLVVILDRQKVPGAGEELPKSVRGFAILLLL